MNFLAYLFLSHLPYIEEEVRYVNGEAQPCLIIPTKTNQIKRGKQGNWLMIFRMAECQPNARQQTHDIQLTYINEDELHKSYAEGYHARTARLGRVYEHDRTPEKKIDRTNRSADVGFIGVIVLSDIPKDLIFRNAENDRRYVKGLCFRSYTDSGVIFTGAMCVDDIPVDEIRTDNGTGKKYVEAALKKMPKLDTYMNTHHLVVKTKDGSEVEIGRFKEWVAENNDKNDPNSTPVKNDNGTEHTTTVNPRDTSFSIDGIEF